MVNYKTRFKKKNNTTINLKAVLCVFISSLENPLSGLEIICKIAPNSLGLDIQPVMFKEGFYLHMKQIAKEAI